MPTRGDRFDQGYALQLRVRIAGPNGIALHRPVLKRRRRSGLLRQLEGAAEGDGAIRIRI